MAIDHINQSLYEVPHQQQQQQPINIQSIIQSKGEEMNFVFEFGILQLF
jgi:hypothetical protein